MVRVAQQILIVVYVVMPAALIGWALWRRMRGQIGPIVSVIFIFACGIGIGVSVAILNSRLVGGEITIGESVRLIYFVIAAMCLVKFLDRLLLGFAFHVARVRVDGRGRPISPGRPRALLGLLAQRLVMLAIIIPYAFSLLLTYRPRMLSYQHPAKVGLDYEMASFRTSDGLKLAGWWIRAQDRPAKLRGESIAAEQWGRRTILICHGIGGGKAEELSLAGYFAARGFNVLAFDFRAHGESDGNFVSFGDREREDVLAAVRWARASHAGETERIFGIGTNTGAAALLAAAADGGDGQKIDAVVLYEPYARLETLGHGLAQQFVPDSVRWLISRASVPLASLHSGTDLENFAPVDYVERLWPRPVLVVHGRGQTFVPVGEEMDLYREMPHPKEQYWPADGTEEQRTRLRRAHKEGTIVADVFREWLGTAGDLSDDAAVRYRTLRFLREAAPTPVI